MRRVIFHTILPAESDVMSEVLGVVLYEVTVDVEPALADAFETYMRRTHIPEIFAIGCFHTVRFDRASPTRFRTCYQASSRAELDRYLQQHTERFRADFATHFPSGAIAQREVWTVTEVWS